MWSNCYCRACTHRDSAPSGAHHDDTITAFPPIPPPKNHLGFNYVDGSVDAACVISTGTVPTTFPVVPELAHFQGQHLRRRQWLCRQQCCAEKLAVRAALKRSLNAQRQRIRRLDEAYRAAERVRSAQRQRRLRSNPAYRAREVLRNRLRRQRKAALHRSQYCSFEELSWLRDCFREEQWSSLKSLWSTPALKVGRRPRVGTGDRGKSRSTITWAEAVASTARLHSLPSAEHQDMNHLTMSPIIVGPEPPGDEPCSWFLVPVPNIVFSAPSTVRTLEDLLAGAVPLCWTSDEGLAVVKNEKEPAE